MPNRMYEYECQHEDCGASEEELRAVEDRDAPGPECPRGHGPMTYVISAGRRQNFNLKAAWKSRNTNFKEI